MAKKTTGSRVRSDGHDGTIRRPRRRTQSQALHTPPALSCFVLMPFGGQNEYAGGIDESEAVYDSIIRPSVTKAARNLKCEINITREVEKSNPGDIPRDIVESIARSDVAIVDLTGRNANVFLELGIRFTLYPSGTVLIAQKASDIPFNIGTYRTVIYSPLFYEVDKAKTRLESTVQGVLQQKLQVDGVGTRTDSLVYNTFPDLEVRPEGILPLTHGYRHTDEITWDDYWRRIETVAKALTEEAAQGHYQPDVLVGISNGGLFFADSVLRIGYSNRVPMVALWANRQAGSNYFMNDVNDAVVLGFLAKQREKFPKAKRSRKLELLVFDDMVGTGTTFDFLLGYLDDKIPDWKEWIELRFIYLYASPSSRVQHIRQYLLVEHELFRVRLHVLNQPAAQREFPYRKELAYGDTSQSEV